MRTIEFASQELLAVIVGTAAKTGLSAAGLPVENVNLAVKVIEAVAKGIGLSKDHSSASVVKQLNQLVQGVLDNQDLPESCQAELQKLLCPKELIKFFAYLIGNLRLNGTFYAYVLRIRVLIFAPCRWTVLSRRCRNSFLTL